MLHKSSFGVRTTDDFLYKMVIPQYEDFAAGNASSRHALLALILVHHMYEWAHGKSFTKEHFLAKYPDKLELVDLFELARAISNGTKHFAPRAKTSAGVGYSSKYSEAYERPLNVEFPPNTAHAPHSGRRISADRLLRDLVTFWKDHFPANIRSE